MIRSTARLTAVCKRATCSWIIFTGMMRAIILRVAYWIRVEQRSAIRSSATWAPIPIRRWVTWAQVNMSTKNRRNYSFSWRRHFLATRQLIFLRMLSKWICPILNPKIKVKILAFCRRNKVGRARIFWTAVVNLCWNNRLGKRTRIFKKR